MTNNSRENVTITDIANSSGVSVMTVSRFFNQPEKVSLRTRKKIETTIENLNYQPNVIARSLITRKSFTIGVVVPDIRNSFFNTIYYEIDRHVKPLGYNLLLCNTGEDEVEEISALKTLLSRAVDGIIIAPVSSGAIDFLNRKNTPYVLIDRKFEGMETDYIGCDHYNGMREAIDYLVSLGHRDISLIAGPGQLYPYEMRTLAYTEALEKNGIPLNPLYLHQVKVTDTSFAYEAVQYLLKLPKPPTAIVASNNIIGQGCLKALHSSKISIPDELSFIVFDKISGYDLINPTITCITQPIEFIGKNAAGFLLERLKGDITGFQKAIVMPELVFGNSCKILDI